MQPTRNSRQKDYCGAFILCALGTATAIKAQDYHLGTLKRMGPGFVPTALGVILVIVGLILFAGTLLRRDVVAAASGPKLPSTGVTITLNAEWRGWLCICAGVLAFAFLAERAGLIPATFACVGITAMGDRDNGWREAVLLSVGMAIFAVAVFWWGLGVRLALVEGLL